MKAFINSQFGYCPLVWIFCSRKINTRIDRIHGRALRTVYSDIISTFKELLNRDKSVTIHVRNLQVLVTEIFKVINGLASDIMKTVFPMREQIRYLSQNIFENSNIFTTKFGIESLAHFGPKLWQILPNDLKNIKTLDLFKKKIKSWVPDNCPFKLCKTYIKGIGFIN